MSNLECLICMEKIKALKYFHCDKCQIDICRQCLKDSIITYGRSQPNCPNCHENISYALLAKIISKKFIQEDLFNYLTNMEFEVLNKEKIKLIANVFKVLILSLQDKITTYVTKSLHNYLYPLSDFRGRQRCDYITNEDQDGYAPHKKTISIYKNIIMSNIDSFMNELKTNIENKTLLKKNDNTELSLEKTININIEELVKILLNVMSKREIENIFQQYLGKYIDEDLLEKSTITSSRDLKELIKKELKKDDTKTFYIFRCTECEFGFIDKKYICSSCKKQFCDKCLKEIHENECNIDDVKTANSIYKDTKPCPNCFTRIYKISGCNQMFCTYCKKGFDWKTGAIIENNFHNPHRMEWLQNGGQDGLPDLACLNDYQIRFIENYVKITPSKKYLNNLHFYSNYIQDVLNEHRRISNNINDETEELYLLTCYAYSKQTSFNKENSLFILNEIDFKRTLKFIISKRYFENIYVEIYETMREILISTLIRIDQILGYKYDNGCFKLTEEDIRMIDDLYDNCYIFIRDIEKTRIEDLETYLNMNFIKPVNFKNELNIYSWNPKETGLKTYEEFYIIYNTLIEKNDNEVDLSKTYKQMNSNEYNKFLKRKIGTIFKYINNYIKEEYKQNALKNISKLNLSFDEKEFVYNLLK